jgi:hypothetical protein
LDGKSQTNHEIQKRPKIAKIRTRKSAENPETPKNQPKIPKNSIRCELLCTRRDLTLANEPSAPIDTCHIPSHKQSSDKTRNKPQTKRPKSKAPLPMGPALCATNRPCTTTRDADRYDRSASTDSATLQQIRALLWQCQQLLAVATEQQ